MRRKMSFWERLLDKTEFESIKYRLLDEPSGGFSAWARTTAGVVAFLFFLQLLTGVLLAFYYVPTTEHAYISVAYIEKVVPSGSWIRSLHYHCSILLPLALVAHLAQMIVRNSYVRLSTAWTFSLIFLALVLAAAATGYALPWDARAFNGVNVAVSLAGHAPLIGESQKVWLQNGATISTLTLSRFYALHVFLTPALILLCIAARLFFFGRKEAGQIDTAKFSEWARMQFFRNAVVIGAVFLGLAVYCANYPAPFGATAKESASYLSRPGPQFLWLFEIQNYLSGATASILSFGFPALIIGGLVLVPFLLNRFSKQRLVVSLLFIIGIGTVAALTISRLIQDANDPRTREQFAKQAKDEAEFRAAEFKPMLLNPGQQAKEPSTENNAVSKEPAANNTQVSEVLPPPKVYLDNCAKCHGKKGDGTNLYPDLIGLTTREEDRRSDEDLLGIINDAKTYGLSSKMPAYKNKLTGEQKQEIIKWLKTLN